MTNEEAIKELSVEYFGDSEKIREAKRMAIKALKQEPCEDVISREYLLDNCVVDKVTMPYVPVSKIENAPPVTSKSKTGYWIVHPHERGVNWEYDAYECSECHEWSDDDSNYCPECGCRMVEPQKSEVKE